MNTLRSATESGSIPARRLAVASGLLAAANMLSACGSPSESAQVDSETVEISYSMNTVNRAACEAIEILSERNSENYSQNTSCTSLAQSALSEYVRETGERFVYPGDTVTVSVSESEVLDVAIKPVAE